MNLRIKAVNLELTPGIKDYVQEKMDMLEKYLGDLQVISANVEVGKINNHHQSGEIYKTEINLTLGGDLLRVEKVEDDFYKSIDNAKDHLAEMIVEYKEKKRGR